MEIKLLAYGFLIETVFYIIFLYQNMKAMFHLADGDLVFCIVVKVYGNKYINSIFLFNQSRLYCTNASKFNKRTSFQIKKRKGTDVIRRYDTLRPQQ